MGGRRFNSFGVALIGDKIEDLPGFPPFLMKQARQNFIND
jgi:hypothetical protein